MTPSPSGGASSSIRGNPMRSHWNTCFIWTFFVTLLYHSAVVVDGNQLEASEQELDLALGDIPANIRFTLHGYLQHPLTVELEVSYPSIELLPWNITFRRSSPSSNTSRTQKVEVLTHNVTSLTFIDVKKCFNESNGNLSQCPFNNTDVFIRVRVVHSRVTSALVIITGWIYFFAWSISFYPQIMLNFQRKSVTGLNFDFLVLNTIGFTCYTIYNVLLYFDANVQDIYQETHKRSLIPVLLNDVVFAAHALLACIITGFQCFFYERGPQRISYICWVWSSLLVSFSAISLFASVFTWLNWLQFINFLSYVKMAVTLSKYFPQAILNFRRQSTVGWSIGNVLLDFSGGFMDICQMVLQASNTDDWSAFYGNPVKFGLGMISMVFDVVFMLQHYVLYPGMEAPLNRISPSPSGESDLVTADYAQVRHGSPGRDSPSPSPAAPADDLPVSSSSSVLVVVGRGGGPIGGARTEQDANTSSGDGGMVRLSSQTQLVGNEIHSDLRAP